ncbi:MAG: N-acyl-D-glutamate amidohydrolase [Myxococcota bacterium]
MQEQPATISIEGGTVYDGTGAPGRQTDVLIRDGLIARMGAGSVPPGAHRIDARGRWVTPGFVDLHTHYDAEVEIAPALSESVRHGVTTVMLGSCGLGMTVGRPVDLADMFCRVEGIPRSVVLPLFERVKDWDSPAGYLAHLDRLPLGPNVTSMLGHSGIRAHVMGIARSLDASVRPTAAELDGMTGLLEEALDCGYVGLSINTLPWDKMDGEAHRSLPTPSVFARWPEYRRLVRSVRRRGRVFQGVPNLKTKYNIALFMLEALPLLRKPVKTMILTMMDAKSARVEWRLADLATRLVNLLGADLRFQALPNPFDLWTDGLEVPVLEEIQAGTEALSIEDPQRRSALLREPAYRRRFKRQWRDKLFGRAYHRDLDEARIIDAPDPAVVGKSFGQVARERGDTDPVDTFLDLQADHGHALRWYTVVGNDRIRWLRYIMDHPGVLIGFSDAGAHLRNMAYYNYPLRMLKRVQDAAKAGTPFMSVEKAVWRLTGEIADWLSLDAGRLAVGKRADVVVLNPDGLDDAVETIEEAPMPGFSNFQRLVRRNDAAVDAVVIRGRVAWQDGSFNPQLGTTRGFGGVLRAAHSSSDSPSIVAPNASASTLS